MKKLIMLCILLSAVVFVQAQAKDSTLNDFVGKYKFPDGSIVTEVVVSMEGEALTMSSSVGTSPLVKAGEDLFAITAFEGTAQFKRDANKKVIGVNINAGGYVLEGTKSEGVALNYASAILLKRQSFFQLK